MHNLRRKLTIEHLERREVLHAGVYPTVDFHTNFGTVNFEVLDLEAPGTVDNFLTYINDGDYQDMIFHRLVTNFVLQGGGFTASDSLLCDFESCTGDDVSGDLFAEVPTDDPIQNEFGVSNTRGTVAMAKLGGDPDSATSQWYINLNDNSANLDNQNGGFTVFARVTNMDLVDQITGLNTINMSNQYDRTDRRSAIGSAPVIVENGETNVVSVSSITGSGLLHGTVYLDANQNGALDSADGGRAGVTVFNDLNANEVLDENEPTTTSDNSGAWHLFVPDGGSYNVRALVDGDNISTGALLHSGNVEFGQSERDLDFFTAYTGTSFHNDLFAEDVDGVNGVSPLDALLVINELSSREFSDASTGDLVSLSEPLPSPRFIDINDDGQIAPLDALLVINRLTESPAEALSSSAFPGDLGLRDVNDEADDSDREAAQIELIDLALLDLDEEL